MFPQVTADPSSFTAVKASKLLKKLESQAEQLREKDTTIAILQSTQGRVDAEFEVMKRTTENLEEEHKT